MASGKIFICLVLLVTANYMLAQDSQEVNEELDQESNQEPPPNSQGPDFGSFDVGNFLNAGEPEDDEDLDARDHNGPQSRFFFSSLFSTRLVSCNYTSQAGASCPNCRQVLRCFSGDVGTLVTCRGFFPYCNNGRCSLYQQANCTSVG